ncbi:MAG: choice-of-anchor K domain-containing protein [Cyanobacteria bacterium J06634_5]
MDSIQTKLLKQHMTNNKFSTLIGAGALMIALGTAAKPAEAFVITNTSADWDNVSLYNGSLVGSDGVAASTSNKVKFLEKDDMSQVRWGSAVYGERVGTGEWRQATWKEKRAGLATKRYYWNYYGQKRSYWAVEKTKVVATYKNQSGLGFEGVSNLDLDVNEIFNIGTLTHFNQTIWGDGLDGTKAEFSLDLDFGDSGIGSQSFDFSFSIDETVNSQTVCPYQTDANRGGCSDRISWDFAIHEKNTFEYEDETYSLELVGFGNELASRGIVNEFISQENGDNSAGLFARLVKVDTTKDIPEPASLLGLAAFGLYFASSRQKKKGESAAAAVS